MLLCIIKAALRLYYEVGCKTKEINLELLFYLICGVIKLLIYWLKVNDLMEGFCHCRYKLGFCPNGPDCRYRHAKLPGPPPPVEEVLQKIQHLNSYNYNNSNKFSQQRNGGFPQQHDRSQPAQVANSFNQVVVRPSAAESANVQQPQQFQQTQQQVAQTQAQSVPNGLASQANRAALPLPQGISRCVQSPKVFY